MDLQGPEGVDTTVVLDGNETEVEVRLVAMDAMMTGEVDGRALGVVTRRTMKEADLENGNPGNGESHDMKDLKMGQIGGLEETGKDELVRIFRMTKRKSDIIAVDATVKMCILLHDIDTPIGEALVTILTDIIPTSLVEM